MIRTSTQTILVIKMYFATFLLVFNVFMFGYSLVIRYEFSVEEIPDETVIKAEKYPGHEDIANHYLSVLTEAPRRDMCRAAKVHALLDGMAPDADVFPAYGYKFEYPDGSSKELIAMRCSTIPVSYIYRSTPSSKLIIVLKENEFMTEGYEFSFDIVRSTPKLAPNDIPRMGPLSKEQQDSNPFKANINFLNLCVAAKKRIDYRPAPEFYGTSLVDKPLEYEIRLESEPMIKRYTVKCPSSPPMFVFYEKPETVLKVIIVKTNPKKRLN